MKKDYWNEPMSRKNWVSVYGLCVGIAMMVHAGLFGWYEGWFNFAKKGFNKIKTMVKKNDVFED